MIPGKEPGKRSAASPTRGRSNLLPLPPGTRPIGSWPSTMRTRVIRPENEDHAKEPIADDQPGPVTRRRLGCASDGLRHSDGSVQLYRGGLRGERGNYATPR